MGAVTIVHSPEKGIRMGSPPYVHSEHPEQIPVLMRSHLYGRVYMSTLNILEAP